MEILYQSRYQDELLQMIEVVKKNTFHPYANQYVAYPEIDFFQMHFIYLFLRAKGFTQEIREMYCVCQMLIQLGLDCMDNVGTEKIEDEKAIKNRQLTVLSGDFFSSYYYYYLAQKKQNHLIEGFAKVLKSVNEFKMKLHQHRDALSEKDLVSGLIEARSQLPNAVLSWHDAEDKWYEVYRLFLKTKFYRAYRDEKVSLEQIIQHLDRQLKQFEKDVQSEFRLWLDKTQQEHMLIGS